MIGSVIGCPDKQRATVRGLGLRRMHQVVERLDTPEIRGMVKKVPHLVAIVGAEEETNRGSQQPEAGQGQRRAAASAWAAVRAAAWARPSGRGEKGQKSRSGFSQQGRVRGRPDAAAPPRAQARLHEPPLPQGVRARSTWPARGLRGRAPS